MQNLYNLYKKAFQLSREEKIYLLENFEDIKNAFAEIDEKEQLIKTASGIHDPETIDDLTNLIDGLEKYISLDGDISFDNISVFTYPMYRGSKKIVLRPAKLVGLVRTIHKISREYKKSKEEKSSQSVLRKIKKDFKDNLTKIKKRLDGFISNEVLHSQIIHPELMQTKIIHPQIIRASKEDYRGDHKAPNRNNSSPLDDLSKSYPDDIYGDVGKAAQCYGHVGQGDKCDEETIRTIQSCQGKPEEDITIYRAVPIDAPDDIEEGDWVTINNRYAKTHGESALHGNYKIVKKVVKAKDLFTNGDSIHEFGYCPESTENLENISELVDVDREAGSDSYRIRIAQTIQQIVDQSGHLPLDELPEQGYDDGDDDGEILFNVMNNIQNMLNQGRSYEEIADFVQNSLLLNKTKILAILDYIFSKKD